MRLLRDVRQPPHGYQSQHLMDIPRSAHLRLSPRSAASRLLQRPRSSCRYATPLGKDKRLRKPQRGNKQRSKREVEGARLRHNTTLRVAPAGLCPLCLGLPRVWSPLQGCAPWALGGSPPWGFSSLGVGAALGGDALPPLYLIDTEGRPFGASPPFVWVRPWARMLFRPYTYRYSTSGLQGMHAARDEAEVP